jgi:hypothetical protein
MVTQNTRNGRAILRIFARLLTAIVLVQIIAGCGTTSQTKSPTPTSTSTPQGQVYGPVPVTVTGQTSKPAPEATQAPGLHGPTNFVLNTPLNFVDVNGTTTDDNGTPTAIDSKTVEDGINQEFQRILFVMDNNGNLNVYNPGTTTPIKAQITQQTDNSAEINYTQTANSALGSAQIEFDGMVTNSQINASYQQDYSPSLTSNGVQSNVAVTFSATIKWVAPDQIPTSPLNGQFQFTNSGGIALSWSAGQHAVAYNVYRIIPSEDQEYQLIATVKGTSYTDPSSDAWQNAHSSGGITYGVFAVGPTGVENPGGIPIHVATS